MKLEVKQLNLFENDLTTSQLDYYLKKDILAIDTETRGLVIHRDRLCLVQICDNEGVVSIVRYHGKLAPNLKTLLETKSILKLFHFARFDVAVLKHYLNAQVKPIWCTKIASKLIRTYTDKHGLKELAKEILSLELDKGDQMSDWAKGELTNSQLEYAAKDVLVLIPIYTQLKSLLEREGQLNLALSLFDFLPSLVSLDLGGWKDIFEH